MKSKLSMKILGVVVTVATVASLLVGITAAPVSAAAGANAWAVQSTPSAVGKVFVAGVNTNQFVISPDGNTIFAWDNAGKNMYVSTNAGLSFGTPVPIAAAGKAVDMVISPNYATDKTAVLVEGDAVTVANNHVWWTTNGGVSWADVAPASLQAQIVAGNWITSVDIANYWSNNTLTLIIGIAGPLVAGSNVLKFTSGSFAWTAFGSLTDPVFGVKFSPNHISDSEVMAVFTIGANTYLSSSIGGLAFDLVGGAVAYPRTLIVAGAVTGTVNIATASDYIANTGAPILVGTAGLGGADGVYRINGRNAGSGGSAAVVGAAIASPIASLAVSGPLATATAYYTLAAQAAGGVWRSTTFNVPATATWAPASKITGATGVTTLVALGGTFVYASTSGVGATDCALQRSADGGADFSQISLIDVTTVASVSLVNLEVVDANTMFLIMNDTAALPATKNSLFKTVNGGTNWERILTGPATMTLMSASPAYATDTTLVVCDTALAVVKKTVNGGTSFIPYGVLAAPTAVLTITGGMFYTGGVAAFYKSGSFVGAAFPAGFAGTINSIAVSPKDTTGATIAVGTTAGTVFVSVNGGTSFTQDGTAAVGSANPVIVAYGPDGTLYAANNTSGVFSWSGTAWSAALSAGLASGLAVSTDGTLYMTSTAAGIGAYRSLNPTAAAPAFITMNATGMGFPAAGGAGSFIDEAVISGTAANTIFGLDTTALLATTGYGYNGALLAFSDTLIVAAATTAPANNAVLTTDTSAAVSWPAVTGATEYLLSVDGSAYASVGNATSWVIGGGTAPYGTALVQGTAHTWSVRVGATNTIPAGTMSDLGRPSAIMNFTLALTAPYVGTTQFPTNGLTNVPVDTTFTWPASTVVGATYEFVIAEELGNVDKFAIIDYSATAPTNATVLRETLKYNTTYWWRVRTVTGTSKSAWTTSFFTTEPEPVVTTPVTTAPPVTTIIVPTQPVATPTVTIINSGTTGTSTPVIPSYLLWAVIAVGAVLVIAVIVLIVRTRKI